MKKSLLLLCAFVTSIGLTWAQNPTSGSGSYEIGSGANNGKTLNYTWEFTQSGMDVTVIFACTNASEIQGLTNGYVHDKTIGLVEHAGLSYTWTNCTEGTVIKAAHKWEYAEGAFTTPDFSYTVQGDDIVISAISITAASTTITEGKTTQLTVKHQDDGVVSANKLEFSSGNTAVATVNESGLVSAISAGTAVITATLKENNQISNTITITVTEAVGPTAAPTPTTSADYVLSIYSDAYTPVSNVGFDNWGSATALSQIVINGNNTLQFNNMNYYGILLNTYLDVNAMEYLHLDVYAESAGTLGVVPIWWNAAANQNFPEIRKTITLTESGWASFDIPLSEFSDASRGGTNVVYQIKLDNGNGNNILVDNIYFWKNAPVATTAITVTAAANEITKGATTQLTVRNQANQVLDASEIDFVSSAPSIASVDETGLVTAKAVGEATITATLKNTEISNTVDITVVAVFKPEENPTAPTASAESVLAVYSATYNKGLVDQNPGWGGGPNPKYTSMTEETIQDEHKVVHVVGTGFCNRTKDAVALSNEYIKVYIAVYPKAATSAKIYGDNLYSSAINVSGLIPGQWNYIDVDNTITSTNYISIELVNETEFYLDHFYFTKLASGELEVTVNDGVATVIGDVTTENVDEINNADAMFIDLTGVSNIENGITITPAHKNALIRVTGTAGDPSTIDEKYENATINGNVIVRRGDGYIFPVNQIQFVDDPTNEPMWNGEGQPINQKFISTGNTGFKVTRTLKAKAIGTVYLPGNSITLPEGVTVWEAVNYSEEDGVTFTKAGVAGVFFPYVVINANNEDVDIYSVGTGDFNLIAWGTGNVAPHKIGASDAYAQGCMSTIVTSASDNPVKYAVSSSATHNGGSTAEVTLLPCKGVTISPFRAFFYGFNTTGAPVLAMFDDGSGTTMIGEIHNGEITRSEVYDMQGRRVQNPTKGIYIVNGKKVIIK